MRAILLLCAIAMAPLAAAAQRLPATDATLYNDSIAFVRRSGAVQFQNRKTTLKSISGVVEGTMNIQPRDSFHIQSILVGEDTVRSEATVQDFGDVLQANVGKQAVVTYEINGELEDVVGTIQATTSSNLFHIQQPGGQVTFIQRDQLRQVAVQGQTATSFQRKRIQNATTIEIDRDIPEGELTQTYYRTGLAWRPSYRLRIADSTIRVSLQAEVSNAEADQPIEDAEVKLVNGPSPLGDGAANDGADGAQVYELGTRTIRAGQATLLPVTDYEFNAHLEALTEAPSTIDFAGSGRPAETTPLDVYRAIRFTNDTTDLPAGKALLIGRKGQPLRKLTMATLKRGEGLSFRMEPLAKVSAKLVSKVLSYEKRVKLDDGNRYDRVAVRSAVVLTNDDSLEHMVTVRRVVPGYLRTTSNAEVTDLPREVRGNELHRLGWEMPIPPANSQSIWVNYVYLIPRD